ncbi:transposable element Tc3 transposase [Trichonephila clavipes]|nr:transposable element Tc3 transposase [Trichonephila clavipes]
MSRRKQRSAFDQVSEFDRGKILAYRDCGLSFKEIGSHVERNQTTVMRNVRRTDVVDRIHLSAPLHAAEWNEVVFTDEYRICLQHHDGQIRVWRHCGERILNSCVMHRHTDPATSIAVWDGIGYHSRTPLVRIACTLNSQCYISEVLEPIVLPYLQGFATAIFQQDNARPHVTRIVQRFFVNHQLELLSWPDRSPDLSPIENMWSMVA